MSFRELLANLRRGRLGVQSSDHRQDGRSPTDETTLSTDDRIEFICDREEYGAIPDPEPASKHLPDWYRELPHQASGHDERISLDDKTARKCAPLLDAMTAGWIMKLPYETEVSIDRSTKQMQVRSRGSEELATIFPWRAVGGEQSDLAYPPIQMNLRWIVKVPPGYSLFVVPPLNRDEYADLFQPYAGFIDADKRFNQMNTVLQWQRDYTGVLDAGTPLVQIIPFRRDGMISQALTRPLRDEERIARERDGVEKEVSANRYMEDLWEPKSTRMIPWEGE